jgi:chromosome segregation ATPase
MHTEANARIIAEKDNKIDAQSKKIDHLSEQIADQSEQIAELLGYAKNTKETLDDVQDDLTETKEDVKIAKNHLIEKSKVSTRNPKSESKHHRFTATVSDLVGGWRKVDFTTGAKSYVETKVSKLTTEQGHEIAIPACYNANGFDLRQNCKDAFVKFRKQRKIKSTSAMQRQISDSMNL